MSLESDNSVSALEEFMVVVKNVPSTASDKELREMFSFFGPVMWVHFAAPDCALVRFQKRESVAQTMSTAGNSAWQGMILEYFHRSFVQPPASFTRASSQSGHSDSSASGALPDLFKAGGKVEAAAFYESGAQEAHDFTLQAAVDASSDVSELVRCNPAWNPSPLDERICEPLEADATARTGPEGTELSSLEAPAELLGSRGSRSTAERTSASGASGQATSVGVADGGMWQDVALQSSGSPAAVGNSPGGVQGSHKSVATTARSDLARMAVLSNLAQSKAAVGSPWSAQPAQPPGTTPQSAQGSPMYYSSSSPQRSGTVSPEPQPSPELAEGYKVHPIPSHLKLRTSHPSGSPSGSPAARAGLAQEMDDAETVIDWQNVNLQNLTDEQKGVLRRYLSSQPGQASPSVSIPTPVIAQHPGLGIQAVGPSPLSVSPSTSQHLMSAPQMVPRPRPPALPVYGQAHKGSLGLPVSATLSGGGLTSSASVPVARTSSPQLNEDVLASIANAVGASQYSSGPSNVPGLLTSVNSTGGDRNMDQAALMQLLQSTKLMEAMSSRGGPSQTPRAAAGAPPMLGPGADAARKAAAKPGTPTSSEWGQQLQQSGGSQNLPSVQQLLSSHLMQEFTSSRTVLVDLMLQAFAFLNSDSMREFYDKLTPVAVLYDEMHELPVVQKRKKCQEMGLIRMQLIKDQSFMKILQAVCALRHHLYSLSRKVLVMNQGPDGIPVDLLLGSMSSELYHLLKNMLPQEVSDFYGNNLPHPKLAVLVFAEFTTVDPMPIGL